MSIYGSAVRRPITTIMIFVGLLVLGLYSLNKLPIDFYPELEFPAISVLTTYSGASAADIETNVTRIIEDNLNTVSNLKDITSTSRDNTSVVLCEFEWGTNLDEASNEIRDALSFAEQFLPDEVSKPAIFKFSSSAMPILFFAVTADESYPAIETILDEKIINPLNRIPGIGSVGLFGAPGREIQVNIDPQKLEGYNLTVEQIAGILNAENLNLPAGNIEMGLMDYPLRIQGEFVDSDVIKEIVLTSYNGQTVYLKDVATVNDTIREMNFDEKISGETGLRLIIQKQSGANTVEVARSVNEMLPELIKSLPEDIEIRTLMDSSDFIQDSIDNLTRTLLFAAIFVILVVLLFLGRWRATIIIILTIPISLIVAFIYLFISGGTINIITLSSLSIAIGMVVDDAIVVLENITKHVERGDRPAEAAIYATNEVWLAVIVTTLTIVAVFLPLSLVRGMTGELFRPLGIVVSITVVTSTIAAITLTPMLASKMMRLRKKPLKPRLFSYDNLIGRFLDNVDNFYEKSLRVALKYKWGVLIISLAIFAGSLFAIGGIGFQFLPEADQSSMSASIELQTGTRVDETIKVARRIDNFIESSIPEVNIYNTSAGSDDRGGIMSLFMQSGSHRINYNIRMVPVGDRERDIWAIADTLRQYLKTIPEIVNYSVVPNGGMGAAQDNSVSIEIYGYNFETTSALAEALADSISTIPGATNVDISRDPVKPQLEVIPDREKMAQHGLNTYNLANAVRNRVEGPYMSSYREDGDEYDIVVRFNEEGRNTITDIMNIGLMTPQGTMVRLGEVASIKQTWSPPNIERKSRERIVTVSVTPYKVSLSVLAEQIQSKIEQLDIPPEVNVQMSGAVEDLMDAMNDLALLLALSLILVYIVMASQFESLKMPLIIMFSIPFAFSGVILAHIVTGITMSVISMVGGIMLVGIVVKNAIVLVDFINLMRDRGYSLKDAVILSGRSRLRPVLMTTFTTILGMLPLAVSRGEGSEIWSPMGISVIGGLIFSTFVTMILVPVVYIFFMRRSVRRKQLIEYDFMNGN
ncbi:MAG: efflux RND transporter permease subunit [Bacteroidales bacterium]|nr:efflux RND transporter permease subunit [Bacteroidales bacterium]MBN2699147.1 efflux RND transporter permease subunit [Bacteroidales bacterium]